VRPIRVPKTPKKAFNPRRRPSALLLGQVAHLEWAVRPAAERKPDEMKKIFRKGKPRTEAAAAEKIAALTRTVLENAAAERQRRILDAMPVVQQAAAVAATAAAPRPPARPRRKMARRRNRRR
jgi:hypothetical protein